MQAQFRCAPSLPAQCAAPDLPIPTPNHNDYLWFQRFEPLLQPIQNKSAIVRQYKSRIEGSDRLSTLSADFQGRLIYL